MTSFSFSYNDDYNDKNIIKIIADNYYIARTGTEPLMLFQCINEKNFIDNTAIKIIIIIINATIQIKITNLNK